MVGEPDKVAWLCAAGFARVGRWVLNTEGQPTLEGQLPIEAGVYALVVDEEICYVGCAQRGVRRRFRKYRNPRNTGTVAVRLRVCIVDALRAGAEVTVFAVRPEPASWNGLPTDTIAGLEEGLIRHLQPSWNVRGLAGIRKAAAAH